jgi:MSHA biogenesis protein MshO
MIMNHKGFSLVEILITLIVSTIVVLMVASLGTMAYKSYKGLRSNSDVYNDSQYALQVIREAVRQSFTTIPATSSTCLTVPTSAATNDYFYSNGTTGFIFGVTACGNTASASNKTIISGVTNLAFTPTVTSTNMESQLVTVTLSGSKNGLTFNYSMNVTRRNP